METPEIIKVLRRNMVETGSLICVGCGREHNCSTHGCAIMREAANMLELLNCRAAPENKPLTCDGCESEDSEEMCEHCSRAIRNDYYARKPEVPK